VNVAPVPIALFWAHSPWGFLGRLIEAMAFGFLAWLALILILVLPRFRH
jgi:hypothetical protein